MPATPPARNKVKTEQHVRAARDARLIEAYRAGRREAFEQLVVAYDQNVRRILTEFRVPLGDVEDLAQEVFLRIFRNLPRFRDDASFYTWLYRITVNVFFDFNKKRRRAEARLTRLQDALVDARSVSAGSRDPYFACYDALTGNELSKAIDALPEAFRTVVSLRHAGDLSYEDIALQTGISVGTVRSRLSRARARLKIILQPILLATAA